MWHRFALFLCAWSFSADALLKVDIVSPPPLEIVRLDQPFDVTVSLGGADGTQLSTRVLLDDAEWHAFDGTTATRQLSFGPGSPRQHSIRVVATTATQRAEQQVIVLVDTERRFGEAMLRITEPRDGTVFIGNSVPGLAARLETAGMVSASTVVIMLDGVPVQQYTAQPAVRSDYRFVIPEEQTSAGRTGTAKGYHIIYAYVDDGVAEVPWVSDRVTFFVKELSPEEKILAETNISPALEAEKRAFENSGAKANLFLRVEPWLREFLWSQMVRWNTWPGNSVPGAMNYLGSVLEAGREYDHAIRWYSQQIDGMLRENRQLVAASTLCNYLMRAQEMRLAQSRGESLKVGYFRFLDRMFPTVDDTSPIHAPLYLESDIIFGVTTQASQYRTQADNLKRTWLEGVSHYYFYGDEPDASLPTTALWSSDVSIQRLAMRDDYLSSVPKFLLGILDMFRRHPQAAWFFLIGTDNYVHVPNLLQLVHGVDASQPLQLGGSVVSDSKGRPVFGGAAGLIFSNGLMQILADKIEPFLRTWMDFAGHDCLACADVAFQRLINQAKRNYVIEQRRVPCMATSFPDTYGAFNTSGVQNALCDRIADKVVHDASVNNKAFTDSFQMCKAQAVLHYLGPRGMRLLHEYFYTWRLHGRALP